MTPLPKLQPIQNLLPAATAALSRIDVAGVAMPISLNGMLNNKMMPGERLTNRQDRRKQVAQNKRKPIIPPQNSRPDIAVIADRRYTLATFLVTACNAHGHPDELTRVTGGMKIDPTNVYIQMYIPAEALGK